MRNLYFFLALICLSFNLPAQIHKKFYDKNGKIIQDSSKAVTYALYELTKEDSVWSAVFFNVNNTPILKGYFLDDDLTMKQGKFDFYSTNIIQKKISEHQSSIDTEVYKIKTCFYDNNVEVGNCIVYDAKGNKRISSNYEDDQLNGQYEEYDEKGFTYVKGQYVNGIRIGDWYRFHADSSVSNISRYSKHGFLYDSKDFNQTTLYYGAYPRFDFYNYIKSFLMKSGAQSSHGGVVVAFTIDLNGMVTKPELIMGVNSELDNLIIQAIKSSPKWNPAEQDKKTVEERLTLVIRYNNDHPKDF